MKKVSKQLYILLIVIIIEVLLFLVSCNKVVPSQKLNLNDKDIFQITDRQQASDFLLDKLKIAGYETNNTAIIEESGDFKTDGKVWYFAWGTNTDDKLLVEAHFAVTEKGEVWRNNIINNDWTLLKTKNYSDANWWGTYRSNEVILGVTGYNGKNFVFTFETNNGEKFDGIAAVYEDNKFIAEYMDIIFELSQDSELIIAKQIGNGNDKKEHEIFAGEYYRQDDNKYENSNNKEDKTYAEIDLIIDKALEIINTVKNDGLSSSVFGFEKKLARDTLSTEEQSLYDEILPKVAGLEYFSYPADKYGYDVLDRLMYICGAIALDWADLENYFMINEVIEGENTVALESKYFMPWDAEQQKTDIDLLREEKVRFDMICERIVRRMPEELSTYDKYRYLATVISLSTDYDYDCVGGWQNGTAYGSIVGGYSICQGYSRGFMALCERADLWCACVEGVVDGVGHMWNKVKLDTGFYHVDVTWSDELGMPDSPEWLQYFMLTEDEISKDHNIVGEVIEVFEKQN